MTKAIVLVSTLLIGGAAFAGSEERVTADKSADATAKERCERNATLLLYKGKQRSRYISECLASSRESPGKAAARRPIIRPPGPKPMPRMAPLGAPPATTGTAPSNAPVAPSALVIGSSGTSTSGSSATSTSGSSGTSIGSSGAR